MVRRFVLLTALCCFCIPLSTLAQVGQLLYPVDDAVNVRIPVMFGWTGQTADIWQLEISEYPDFPTLAVTAITDETNFTVWTLEADQTYYWRVKYGINNLGIIGWFGYSESSSFQTAPDPCCNGDRGNIDTDPEESVNVSDIVFLVDYLFRGGLSLQCEDEADISPLSVSDGVINVSDLVAMVDFLFRGGEAPGPCPTLIRIVDLEPGDDTVNGIATVIDTAAHRVVLWAKTDQWYVQPSVAQPYTYVQSDGSWSSFTYPWDRMLALLVDASYVPGSTRNHHPSSDPGVIGWDEYPDSSVTFIDWSGYRWSVKEGDLLGPGPNYFSDDTLNVKVDASDRLHLNIDHRDGRWYCAEVVLDRSLGYGVYTFKLDSRVDSLDYNAILGGFIYEIMNREFDFEFSQRLANPFNAQYVVQPWYTPGNIVYYHMPNVAQSTHSFEWRANHITFTSWIGHDSAPEPETLIHSWIYMGPDIPPPGGERMRFNLHLFNGEAPVSGEEDEVILKSFDYSP